MLAGLVVVIAGLRAAKPILLPLLLAFFLSVLSAPLLAWLRRHRFPEVIAVVFTVLANVTVLAFMLLLIGSSVADFQKSLPDYRDRVEVKAEKALDWLERHDFDTSELDWLQNRDGPADDPDEIAAPDALISLGPVVDLVGSTLRGIVQILSMTLIVFLLMIFMLFEASRLPEKLRNAFGWEAESMKNLSGEVQHYLVIKTVVSLTTGLLVGLWVWMLGVPYALLWGLTAFMLNYIPSIGSMLAAVPAMALTWLDLGPGRALLVGLGYLVINMTLGNFLEPHLMGRRFGISTLVVVLSLLFWGWLWGPVGMLLSVPLTMIVKIMLERTEDFRWVARLIGSGKMPLPRQMTIPSSEENVSEQRKAV